MQFLFIDLIIYEYYQIYIYLVIGICFVIILFPVTFLVWLITFPFDKKKTIIHWLLVLQSMIICQLIPAKIIIRGREKT